jgi:TRAP-type C4-dicarboxylate transport system permease large subunit/TRAP-type C4-dicarboxylate transport system permease small subunit
MIKLHTAFRRVVVAASATAVTILLLVLALIVAASTVLRFTSHISWPGSYELPEALATWIAVLSLPLIFDARTNAQGRTWTARFSVGMKLALFTILACCCGVAALRTRGARMIDFDISTIWIVAALPVGFALTILVLISRLWGTFYEKSHVDSTMTLHILTTQRFAALMLFLVGAIWITFTTGPEATGKFLQRVFSEVYVVTIAMLALAGELARVVNAELGLRRFVQSMVAGARSAPISAPIIASFLQGPLLMRSGRSYEGEIAREASEMLNVMESQGVNRDLAWNALAAGGACALVMAPSFLGLIAGTASDTSIGQIWVVTIVPGIVLATILIVVATIISRISGQIHTAPRLEPSRLYQAWRDLGGIAALLLTPLCVLGFIAAGFSTPTEVAGLVALSGFAVAFVQPVRPRLKDVLTAMQRSAVVVGDLVFAFAAATTIIFVLRELNLMPTGHPSAWTTVLCGLLLPALLAFLFDVPVALVLSSMFLPLLGTMSEAQSAAPILRTLMLILAALIGAMTRACVFPPAVLELQLAAARMWSICWIIPLLLVWLLVLFAPQIVLVPNALVFGF